MLRKVGFILKVAQVADNLEDLVSKEKQEEVLKAKESGEVIESRNPDFIYIRGRAITADEPNGNGDYFPKEELQASYKTFIGCSMFVNHESDDPINAVGKVLDAYECESEDGKEYWVECLGKIDKKIAPKLARHLETGTLDKTSMGCNVETSICSVCGCTLHTDADEKCAHLSSGILKEFTAEQDLQKYGVAKGKKIKAYSINVGITFNEWSIVDVPADPKAILNNILAKLKSRITKVGKLSTDEKSDVVAQLEKMIIFLDPEDTRDIRGQVCTLLHNCNTKEEDTMKEGKSAVDTILEKLNALEYKTLVQSIKDETPGEHTSHAPEETKTADLELTAELVKEENIGDSYWLIKEGEKELLKATLRDMWGDDGLADEDLAKYAISDIYKETLLNRIKEDGLNRVTQLLLGNKEAESMSKDKKASKMQIKEYKVPLKDLKKKKLPEGVELDQAGYKVPTKSGGNSSPKYKMEKVKLKDVPKSKLPEGVELKQQGYQVPTASGGNSSVPPLGPVPSGTPGTTPASLFIRACTNLFTVSGLFLSKVSISSTS